MRAAQQVRRIYATIHKQAGIFVDNIDEYLIHYINFSYLRRNEVHERFVRIWHAGQIGAWLALRRLHGINPHVRIFVSIRKEAYQHAAQYEPQFSNLRSFRRELRYRMEDIKQIIENNIAVVPKSDLADRTNEAPMLRFLGLRQERAMDYWTRHCSLRPRDAIVIGKEISLIGVKRRSRHEIRNAINSAASERVETLFNEVSPFFSALYPEIFPQVIKSNVLSKSLRRQRLIQTLLRDNTGLRVRLRNILSALSMPWGWSALSSRAGTIQPGWYKNSPLLEKSPSVKSMSCRAPRHT